MKIKLIVIGKTNAAFLKTGENEYEKDLDIIATLKKS